MFSKLLETTILIAFYSGLSTGLCVPSGNIYKVKSNMEDVATNFISEIHQENGLKKLSIILLALHSESIDPSDKTDTSGNIYKSKCNIEDVATNFISEIHHENESIDPSNKNIMKEILTDTFSKNELPAASTNLRALLGLEPPIENYLDILFTDMERPKSIPSEHIDPRVTCSSIKLDWVIPPSPGGGDRDKHLVATDYVSFSARAFVSIHVADYVSLSARAVVSIHTPEPQFKVEVDNSVASLACSLHLRNQLR